MAEADPETVATAAVKTATKKVASAKVPVKKAPVAKPKAPIPKKTSSGSLAKPKAAVSGQAKKPPEIPVVAKAADSGTFSTALALVSVLCLGVLAGGWIGKTVLQANEAEPT